MTSSQVDAYLAALDEVSRATLSEVRRRIAEAIPQAEEGISYGAPVFRIDGKAIAGFSAATKHLSYLPHSGTVVASLDPADLGGFRATKGAVQMPIHCPLPAGLIRTLIDLRRAEAGV